MRVVEDHGNGRGKRLYICGSFRVKGVEILTDSPKKTDYPPAVLSPPEEKIKRVVLDFCGYISTKRGFLRHN